MKKILILGGSVFVGRAITKKLIEEGNKVYVLNRGTHPTPSGAIQITADRNIGKEVTDALGDLEFDAVIDGSAYYAEQTKITVDNLINRTGHYIHISSAAVYCNTRQYPVKENHSRGTCKDWGDYSTQKFLCEEELFKSWRERAFPITIFRPFYLYGPGNNLDRESYVFKRLLTKTPIIVPGMGMPIVQLGYIDDLVDVISGVIHNTKSFGQAYNISGESGITLKGWVETCAEAVGITGEIICVEAKEMGCKAREWFPFRDIHLLGSCEKLKNELGFTPKVSLVDGLRIAFESMQKDTLLKDFSPTKAEIEILEKVRKKC